MSQTLRILIVGNGGREHTLAWKLSQSDRVECIHVVPGNGGTSRYYYFPSPTLSLTYCPHLTLLS